MACSCIGQAKKAKSKPKFKSGSTRKRKLDQFAGSLGSSTTDANITPTEVEGELLPDGIPEMGQYMSPYGFASSPWVIGGGIALGALGLWWLYNKFVPKPRFAPGDAACWHYVTADGKAGMNTCHVVDVIKVPGEGWAYSVVCGTKQEALVYNDWITEVRTNLRKCPMVED